MEGRGREGRRKEGEGKKFMDRRGRTRSSEVEGEYKIVRPAWCKV